MHGSKALTWVALIAVGGAIAGGAWYFGMRQRPSDSAVPAAREAGEGNEPAAVDLEELAERYEAAATALMPAYRKALHSGDAAEITAVRDQLLELTLPKEVRETHIALVLLLEGRLDGSVSAQEAQQRLDALAADTPWLGETAY